MSETAAARRATVERNTRETQIRVELGLDGAIVSGGAAPAIDTPLPFFSHMLDAFARHGAFDLRLVARGDIEIDGHHTVEDTGLALGDAFARALGDRAGIVRFGEATIPMDEVLAQAVVDLSGRPYFVWRVGGLDGRWIGDFDCELVKEFFSALATRAGMNLHLVLHCSGNAHHVAEALFKAAARALRQAAAIDPRAKGAVPSTKGTLTT